MKTKIINGIQVTDETFNLIPTKEFNQILESIIDEKNEDYSGFMAFESWEDIDFVPSYMTDDITDGKQYAMLSLDQIETKEI